MWPQDQMVESLRKDKQKDIFLKEKDSGESPEVQGYPCFQQWDQETEQTAQNMVGLAWDKIAESAIVAGSSLSLRQQKRENIFIYLNNVAM